MGFYPSFAASSDFVGIVLFSDFIVIVSGVLVTRADTESVENRADTESIENGAGVLGPGPEAEGLGEGVRIKVSK